MLSAVLAALLQLTLTLPMSLFVLLVHNWLLGRVMCYLLPMLQVCGTMLIIMLLMMMMMCQDLPSHVIMLSLLAISLERWRVIIPRSSRDNNTDTRTMRTKINMKVVLPVIWLLSSLLVMPYAKFISHFYLDVSISQKFVWSSNSVNVNVHDITIRKRS